MMLAVLLPAAGFTLTVVSGENGQTTVTYGTGNTDYIEVWGDTRTYDIDAGASVSLNFQPGDYQAVKQVLVDGNDVTSTLQSDLTGTGAKILSFEMTADTRVEVSYSTACRVMIMTYTDDEGGAVCGYTSCPQSGISDSYGPFDGAFDFEVGAGTDVTVNFAPEAGCKIDSVILRITGETEDQVLNVTSQISHNSYVLENVSAQTFMQVYYGPAASYNLTVRVNGTGGALSTPWAEVTEDSSPFTQQVDEGTEVEVAILTETGYKLNALLLNNSPVTDAVRLDERDNVYKYTFVMAEDTELAAAFVNDTPEAYARLSEDQEGNQVLTFYYDTAKGDSDYDIGPFTSNRTSWSDVATTITTVRFDESFASARPTSTFAWFYGCSNLTTITGLDYLNTEAVTNMTWMFYGCSSLRTLDLSSFNTQNVTEIRSMFDGCSSLTAVNLSSFDTQNVTSTFGMRRMFLGCSSLTSLDLTSFDTRNVTNMDYMFSDCSSLTTIYVGDDWSTGSVTTSTGMFSECGSLVGGMGTTYDYDHRDATYAHIDGGTANPGYFTPLNGYVATPTFSWSGDELTLSTTTEGAAVYYSLDSADESAMTLFAAPVTVTSDVVIRAQGRKADMANSATAVLDYPYSAWTALLDTVEVARTVMQSATGNENVPERLIAQLDSLIGYATYLYELREATADEIRRSADEISEVALNVQQLANAVSEPYAVLSDDNTVLTFYYDKKKEERNGMSVGPFADWTFRGWNDAASTITEVVFDTSFANYTSLTSTAYWFRNMSNLTTINGMENLNTANVTNMSAMFGECRSLVAIDLSHFSTDQVTDMNSMFLRCHALTTIDLSHFNTANVTTMEGMFYECTGLTNIDLSSFNTSNVTNMMTMFDGCSGLTSLDVTGFSTSNVTQMMQVFNRCSSLQSLDLSNFDTSNATSMSFMFGYCSSLESLDLSHFNTSNVASLYGMFQGCTSLISVNLSSFNTEKAELVSQMFYGCSALTTIYVGDGWSTASVTSGNDMFLDCTNLVGSKGTTYDADHVDYTYAHIDGGTANPGYFSDINAPTSYVINVTVVGNGWVTAGDVTVYSDSDRQVEASAGEPLTLTFTPVDGYKLGTLVVDTTDVTSQVVADTTGVSSFYTLPAIYDSHDVTVTFQNNTDEPYAVPSDDNTVLTFYYDKKKEERNGMTVEPFYGGINPEWWDNAADIVSVVLDSSFDDYQPTSTVAWFSGLTNLTSFTGLEHLHTGSVTDMNSMFSGCSSLTTLDLSSFDMSNVHNVNSMFSGCSSLTSINVDGFRFPEDGISMSNLFSGCSSLTSIDVSSFGASEISTMDNMFSGCSSLTSLDLRSFDTRYVTSMSGMFSGCSALTSLDLSSFITNRVTNVYGMFNGCSALTTIYVFEGWNMGAVTNGGNMFTGCTSLVGSKGTTYDADHVDYTYAHIDGGTANPGYFSDINAPASYNITVTVVGNGIVYYDTTAIDSSAEQVLTATPGSSVTLMLFPDEDNKLGSVTVDGTAVEAVTEEGLTTYTLTDIYDAHSIVVTFEELPTEAYAVLSVDRTMLTFFYDKKKESRNGMSVGPFTEPESRGWHDAASTITSVWFDSSFANCTTLTSTEFWFCDCSNLTSIAGIENLKTDNVTEMGAMFSFCSGLTSLDLSSFNTANVTNIYEMFFRCSGLTTLDLSSFNTANVTNMHGMFSFCSNLTTIYVGDGWSTASLNDGDLMFIGCTSLVGDQGTAYDDAHDDESYAHLDGGTSNPGYLSRILQMGDANGDGEVNIADAVATVNHILGVANESFFASRANMNGDEDIDIFDVTLIVNAALSAAGGNSPVLTRSHTDHVAAEAVRLSAEAGRLYMGIDQASQYTAFQFDLSLPQGVELTDVRLASATTDHQLAFLRRDDGTYRVAGLSMTSQPLATEGNRLVELQLSGSVSEGAVSVSHVLFVTPASELVAFIGESLADRSAAQGDIYDLQGRKLGQRMQQLSKGIYIVNGKKVMIK